MTITSRIIGLVGALGLAAAVVGVQRIIADPRRIAAYGYAVIGTIIALLTVGTLLTVHADAPGVLLGTGVVIVVILALGTTLGYPLLVGFLLWAGITTLRRESRSLANMLALLAGIGLLLLPTTLALVEPDDLVREDVAYYLQYGTHTALFLLTIYIATCFAAFVVASVAYKWRKPRRLAEAVIVLGAGLIHGEVPPLLAGRLYRGIQAVYDAAGDPVLITSGGQGPDEPVAEGVAMREYVLDQGFPADRVLAEDQSTTTQENLQYSRQLLADPDAPVTVVTSSYHVFRAALLTRELGLRAHVVGAPTARYYLPGAFIREFVAIMREHLKGHVIAVLGIVVATVVFTAWVIPAMVMPAGI